MYYYALSFCIASAKSKMKPFLPLSGTTTLLEIMKFPFLVKVYIIHSVSVLEMF
jgi:hypothetical protein